jgi:thiamine-phosphate pyrophosphorylase
MKTAIPRLYAIMDATLLSNLAANSEPAFADMLASSGIELIQYRNKLASSRALFEDSSRIAQALSGRSVRFIVNDRPDIAVLARAGGVHVGHEDLSVEAARAVCSAIAPRPAGNSGFWVGISTHTIDQVRDADRTSPDYIAVGPIFSTSTKERPDAVVGTEFIRRARALTTKPLVAIGGITVERAVEVFQAGADSIAVARDLICAPDPFARASEYLAICSAAFAGLGEAE